MTGTHEPKETPMDQQQPTPMDAPSYFDSHTLSAAAAHYTLTRTLDLLDAFRDEHPDDDKPVDLQLTLNLKPGQPRVTGPDVKILNTFTTRGGRDIHILDLGYADTRTHCTGCGHTHLHPAVPDTPGKRIGRDALQKSFQEATTAAAEHADACTTA